LDPKNVEEFSKVYEQLQIIILNFLKTKSNTFEDDEIGDFENEFKETD
jgi:hypothetical protein